MNARRIAQYRMTRFRRWSVRHKRLLFIIGDIVLLLLLAWQLWPVSESEVAKNEVDMEIETYYEVTADGHPVFFFSNINDTLGVSGGSVTVDSIVTSKIKTHGYWVNGLSFVPSCYGRIMTLAAPRPNDIVKMDSTELRRFVFRLAVRSDDKLAGLQHMRNELHYYVRKHDIADYGYAQIAKFSAVIDKQCDSLERIVDTLQAIPRNAKISVRYVTRYAAIRGTNTNDTINQRCKIIESYDDRFCLVQLLSGHTPLLVNTRLSKTRGMEELTKGIGTASPGPSEGGERDNTSANGSSANGSSAYGSSANGSSAKADSLIAKAEAEALAADSSIERISFTPPSGGTEDGDTLVKIFYKNGSYYEGYWKNGKRNGFGFYVSPHDYLQAGTWKNNVFKGERLTYNSSRIYGIDISRHQHEHDGNKYSIDWSRLRITDLGSATKKDVKGKVDYPVSFMYIKSTEGCTVFNSYYYHDYAMARSKGIRVGSYHFFSTTSPGYKQAWEFLKKTKFTKGDLAPVLDVEPNDWQVKQMGGASVLLSNMRQWLEIVYKQTGQRPILYIGQTFAHKYLTQAPDITGNYLVWVARYGEYQPAWKLAIWQLSSDGHVSGIHGKVDVNVFSGYKSEYNEFLKNHTITK